MNFQSPAATNVRLVGFRMFFVYGGCANRFGKRPVATDIPETCDTHRAPNGETINL